MSNLISFNQLCKEKIESLESYELIEKILLDKDEIEELSILINETFQGTFEIRKTLSYKESLTIFLVGCAKYYFNDREEGGFWSAVKKRIKLTEYYKENVLEAFKKTLLSNNINAYENEKIEGFTRIGSIIAHAGLPENLENNLIYHIANLRYYDISYNDCGQECLDACTYATKSVNSYLAILNKNGTINDYVSDILQLLKSQNTEEDDSLSISSSLQQKLIKYRDEKNNENIRIINGQRISIPILQFDISSNLIYIEFPEQNVENTEKLTWKVFNNKEVISKNIYSNGYRNGKNCFRETKIIINPKEEIIVKLIDDLNNELKLFTIKEKNSCIVFNHKGQLNQQKILSNKVGYILVDSLFKNNNELDFINDYGNTMLYIKPESDDVKALSFINEDKKIEIIVKKPIELFGGIKVFGKAAKFSGNEAFCNLPKILLPFAGKWKLTINLDGTKNYFNLDLNENEIDLHQYIVDYGKVNIRIFNEHIGYKTFRFLYLPQVEAKIQDQNRIKDITKTLELVFEQKENVIILDSNKKEGLVFQVEKSQDNFFGIYRYKKTDYHFYILMKPYSWSIENDMNLLGEPNEKSYISTKDISNHKNCLLTFSSNIENDLWLKINNFVSEPKVFKVKPFNQIILNLNEYKEYISATESSTAISLEKDSYKICDICNIKNNLAIKNLKIQPFFNSNTQFILTWQEDGLKKNREIRVRNIDEPYKYFSDQIQDGRENYIFDLSEDVRFKSNLIIEIAMIKQSNIFDFSQIKEDILDSDNLVTFNYYPDSEPKFNFTDNNINDFANSIYSYIIYRFNKKIFANEEIYYSTLKKIRSYIVKNRINHGDEKVLDMLFKYNLNVEQFKSIIKELRLYMPFLKQHVIIERNAFNQIEQMNKTLYLMYAFLKNDNEQLDRITNNGLSYLIRFKDNEDIMWAKNYTVFKDIENIKELDSRVAIFKEFNKNSSEVSASLAAIIEFVINHSYNSDFKNLKTYIKVSEFIDNVNIKYQGSFVQELFKQCARKKEKRYVTRPN